MLFNTVPGATLEDFPSILTKIFPEFSRKSSRILLGIFSRIPTNIFCCVQSWNSSRHSFRPFSRNIKVISRKILLEFHFGTIPWTSPGIHTGLVFGTFERVQLSFFFLSAIARANLSRIPHGIFYFFFIP